MSSGYVYGTPLSPERVDELVEKISQWTVKYKMEFPTIVFLQSIKPVGRFIGAMGVFYSSAYMGFSPGFSQFGQEAVALLDNPDNIDKLLNRIEALTQEQDQKRDEERREREAESGKSEGLGDRLKKFFGLSRG